MLERKITTGLTKENSAVARAFSEMRLLKIKTWLRSTMDDDRLSSLALMHFIHAWTFRTNNLSKKGVN